MALQRSTFVLAGLGMEENVDRHPPSQPHPLADGVHLRWSFGAEREFPWHGYYLLRRPRFRGEKFCILESLKDPHDSYFRIPGAGVSLASQRLELSFDGTFSSDREIILTENFEPPGHSEIDLRDREYIRFDLLPEHTANVVTFWLGFYRESARVWTLISFDLADTGSLTPNPLFQGGARFVLRDLDDRPTAGVRIEKCPFGLALRCDPRVDIFLPRPANGIRLGIVSSIGGARITALDSTGVVTDQDSVRRGSLRLRWINLKGNDITELRIVGSGGPLLLLGVGYRYDWSAPQPVSLTVRAFSDDTLLEEREVHPEVDRPEMALGSFEFDRITALEFEGGPGAVVDICYVPVRAGWTLDWQALEGFPYPMALPVSHPQYPASGGAETDPAAAEKRALERVRYGPPDPWRGSSFAELHGLLIELVAGGPGSSMRTISRLEPAADGEELERPAFEIRALDLVLLGSLSPAVAQMLGLYWVDQTAQPGERYDYMIVADYAGRFSGRVDRLLNWLSTLPESPSRGLDAWIAFDLGVSPAEALASPRQPRVYDFSNLSAGGSDGEGAAGANIAGIRWRTAADTTDSPSPEIASAVAYHVQRAGPLASRPNEEPRAEVYQLLNETPHVTTLPRWRDSLRLAEIRSRLSDLTPERAGDWPPVAADFLDAGLAEGWYTYRAIGVDLFGRHSSPSLPAAWHDVQDERQEHPFAIQLLDRLPPPPPTGVEAFALDPEDPTRLQDRSYEQWFATLSQVEKSSLVGLRVRWLWTDAQARQAPDTREFRVYLQPGLPAAAFAPATEFRRPRAWQQRLWVVGIEEGREDFLFSVHPDRPEESFAGTGGRLVNDLLVLPEGVPVEILQPLLDHVRLAGDTARESGIYRILGSSPGARELTLDGVPRLATATTDWSIGRPLRRYEIFLPAPGDADRSGLDLPTRSSEPIRYASVGVSAADGRQHAADDPARSGTRWGDRPGNESTVAGPATVFRVHRTPPAPPELPAQPERAYATRADYHGRSIYTVRWRPRSSLHSHVFRALDDSVFRVDWLVRSSRAALSPSNRAHSDLFPNGWRSPRRRAAADELSAIRNAADYSRLSADALLTLALLPGNEGVSEGQDLARRDLEIRQARSALAADDQGLFPSDWSAARRAAAAAELNSIAGPEDYQDLSDDGLRILAGLPGNDRAFTGITLETLDPEDPARANRLGPDNPDDFDVDPQLRAFEDSLDGRSRNRFFYRVAFVDEAHNLSELSLASAPVYLPDIVPPQRPAFTRVLAGDPDSAEPGDRKITLRWVSNRENDLAQYRVYRTDDASQARDVRRMSLVHTADVPTGDPQERPGEVVWVDDGVQGLLNYHYRLVAVDGAGNASRPSEAVTARAYDRQPPKPPEITAAWIEKAGRVRAEINWTSEHEVLLQRQEVNRTWVDLTQWREPGTSQIRDFFSDPFVSYRYRCLVRNIAGLTARGQPVALLPNSLPEGAGNDD